MCLPRTKNVRLDGLSHHGEIGVGGALPSVVVDGRVVHYDVEASVLCGDLGCDVIDCGSVRDVDGDRADVEPGGA